MEYSPRLSGVNTSLAVYYNGNAHNSTIFNNWNFTEPKYWDGESSGFLYNVNTTELARSKYYILGKESLEKVKVKVQSERVV